MSSMSAYVKKNDLCAQITRYSYANVYKSRRINILGQK